VEGLDPQWSAVVGPYVPGPMAPSGTVTPITVTVLPGGDVEQDILMTGSEQPLRQGASSWDAPLPVPASGDWVAALSEYGDADYFSFGAQANRTLSVSITALDEASRANEVKARPVIGMWDASDAEGSSPPR
jgi:hypothetical protein